MKDRQAVLQVLQMLEQGKITAEEAEALLQALDASAQPAPEEKKGALGGRSLWEIVGQWLSRRSMTAPPEARHAVAYSLEGIERVEILLEGGGLSLEAEPKRTLLEGETNAEETWQVEERIGRWSLEAMPWTTRTQVRIPDHIPFRVQGEGCALKVQHHRAPLDLVIRGGKALVEDHQGELRVDLEGGGVQVKGQAGPVDLSVQGGKADLSLRTLEPLSLRVEGGAAVVQVPAGVSFRIDPQVQGGVIQFDAALRQRLHGDDGTYVIGEDPQQVLRVEIWGGRVKFTEHQ